MLAEPGYDARSISEGLAVVFGEMESSNYTGIEISCGGGLCKVCLVHLSVPVLSFSIAKAGDFIDSSVASVRGRAGHAHPHHQGRIVPLQRAFRQSRPLRKSSAGKRSAGVYFRRPAGGESHAIHRARGALVAALSEI